MVTLLTFKTWWWHNPLLFWVFLCDKVLKRLHISTLFTCKCPISWMYPSVIKNNSPALVTYWTLKAVTHDATSLMRLVAEKFEPKDSHCHTMRLVTRDSVLHIGEHVYNNSCHACKHSTDEANDIVSAK